MQVLCSDWVYWAFYMKNTWILVNLEVKTDQGFPAEDDATDNIHTI